MHGNNLSTLHQHLPLDILPSELGGTGPAFNPGLWAEPVIHSAIKEAELSMENGKDLDATTKSLSLYRNGSKITQAEMQRETSRREAGDGSETSDDNKSKIRTYNKISIEMKNMQSNKETREEQSLADDEQEKLSKSTNSELKIVHKENREQDTEEKRNLIS